MIKDLDVDTEVKMIKRIADTYAKKFKIPKEEAIPVALSDVLDMREYSLKEYDNYLKKMIGKI